MNSKQAPNNAEFKGNDMMIAKLAEISQESAEQQRSNRRREFNMKFSIARQEAAEAKRARKAVQRLQR